MMSLYTSNPHNRQLMGGDGTASVTLNDADATTLEMMKLRTASDPTANPVTGAELGSGLAQGKGAV